MDTVAIAHTRAEIARLGALLFERGLTDAAGGNLSARVGEVICISPRYSGSKYQWRLRPEQVLVADLQGNILDGEGEISREAKAHFKLHNEFAEYGTAVIHAHARYVLVFAALGRPMPPVLEQTLKFGEVPVIDFAPAHSDELAENIAAALRGQEERIRKQAAGVIAPWHGLFIMARDIGAAFDAVERMNTNAQCIILGQLLSQGDALAQQRAALAAAIAPYKQ